MAMLIDDQSDIDGRYSWVILTAGFFIYIINAGTTKSFGILYVEFLNYFGASAAETAWIGSLQFFLFFALGPLSNYLVVRYSFRKVMFCGALLISVAFLSSAFVREVHMLYLTMGVILGIGYGLVNTPNTTIIQFYFDKHRALANGLVTCGSGIGSVCFPYIYQSLIDTYEIKGALFIISSIALNICVFVCLLRQPKEACLEHHSRYSSIKTFFDLSYFKIPTFTLYAVALLFNIMGYAGNFIIFPAHLKQLGFSSRDVTIAFSIIGATELISRIFIGWFADFKLVHPKVILTFCIFVSTVVPSVFPVFTSYSAVVVYACFVGIFPGAFWSLMAIVLLECVGLKKLPSAIGVLSLGLAFGMMISQVFSGWLRDITGTWHMSFRLLSIFNGVAFLLLVTDIVLRLLLLGKDMKMEGPDLMEHTPSYQNIQGKGKDTNMEKF